MINPPVGISNTIDRGRVDSERRDRDRMGRPEWRVTFASQRNGAIPQFARLESSPRDTSPCRFTDYDGYDSLLSRAYTPNRHSGEVYGVLRQTVSGPTNNRPVGISNTTDSSMIDSDRRVPRP